MGVSHGVVTEPLCNTKGPCDRHTGGWHMSWGYWAIVTGLALLLGVSFFSVALIYSGAHHWRQVLGGPNVRSTEGVKEQKRAA